MKKKDVLSIINQEISYHKANMLSMPREYAAGFISGLEQAKRLIIKFREGKND